MMAMSGAGFAARLSVATHWTADGSDTLPAMANLTARWTISASVGPDDSAPLPRRG